MSLATVNPDTLAAGTLDPLDLPRRPVLRLIGNGLPPATPPTPRSGRLHVAGQASSSSAGWGSSTPGATHGSPARDQQLVASMATIVVEVLQGRRPGRQLGQCLDSDPAALVQSWSRATRWEGARVVSVRAQRPSSHAIEGCARVEVAGRSLMVVLRLEAAGRRWRGVRLDLIGTPGLLRLLGLDD